MRQGQSGLSVPEGLLLWTPPDAWQEQSNLSLYVRWMEETKGKRFKGYDDLWEWSVTDLEGFWSSIAEFFRLRFHRPPRQILTSPRMPGAKWFVGAEVNYAEHALQRRDDHPAVLFQSELRPLTTLTYSELAERVAEVATALRQMGVGRGDRVVAYAPNIPETLIAFLATASLGAIWSSCSPDFGVRSVLDRFRQIEPKVFFIADGYSYNGKPFSRLPEVAEIQRHLPTLQTTVLIPYLSDRPDVSGLKGVISWADLFKVSGSSLTFEPVPFDHPLWVLFSSGTTGLPKAIIHGHGGMLLEHYKCLSLHWDLKPDDRFFWFTTTGWMMWNFIVSGLLLGATVLLYDGSPSYPNFYTLWGFAEATKMTHFGTSAPYIHACMKAGLVPKGNFDLSALRMVGSTGAPLTPEGFKWVYECVKGDVLLGSFSGGTDMCTGFVGPCVWLPVHAGEIQCRCLGAKVEAYDENGNPVIERVGELVITEPMPCMPVGFWDDPDGRRYRESYFTFFPGVWRHGDWIKITRRGSCVIYGRSDATIKRAGVRMGTSEFYRVVEELPEVVDSLVVDTSQLGEEGKLLLFVVLREGVALNEALKERIRQKVRADLSPRHVPDEIHAVPEIPRTLNDKKVEVPVKRILLGQPPEKVINPGSLKNPDALLPFLDLARQRPFMGGQGANLPYRSAKD